MSSSFCKQLKASLCRCAQSCRSSRAACRSTDEQSQPVAAGTDKLKTDNLLLASHSVMHQRDKILVVSRNPRLAHTRRRILEKAGFEVLAAKDSEVVKRTCSEHRLRAVVVGHSVLPAVKRRVWAEAREHCRIPVLELRKNGSPELMPTDFFCQPSVPDDLRDMMPLLERLH
jgi:CheY-like chemotaxis protein